MTASRCDHPVLTFGCDACIDKAGLNAPPPVDLNECVDVILDALRLADDTRLLDAYYTLDVGSTTEASKRLEAVRDLLKRLVAEVHPVAAS